MAIDAHASHHKVKGNIPGNTNRHDRLFHAPENGWKSEKPAKKVPDPGWDSHAYAAFQVLTLVGGSGQRGTSGEPEPSTK
jgi:hypothetical protein